MKNNNVVEYDLYLERSKLLGSLYTTTDCILRTEELLLQFKAEQKEIVYKLKDLDIYNQVPGLNMD